VYHRCTCGLWPVYDPDFCPWVNLPPPRDVLCGSIRRAGACKYPRRTGSLAPQAHPPTCGSPLSTFPSSIHPPRVMAFVTHMFFTTPDTRPGRESSMSSKVLSLPSLYLVLPIRVKAKSRNTTKQVPGQIPDEKEPHSWSLFWPTRKYKSTYGPLPPLIFEGIQTPHTAKSDSTVRCTRREVLDHTWKLFSQRIGLTSSRVSPVPQLQVFIEVHRETFCDSERRDVTAPRTPLGPAEGGIE
jgi:hypothetical protein